MSLRGYQIVGLGLCAAFVFGAASAQTPPVSEKAAAVAQAAQAALKAQQQLLEALPPTGSVADELSRRTSLDQFGRQIIGVVSNSGLSDADRTQALDLIWKDLQAIDIANSDYVKSVLPADGWFRNSRDGARVSSDAWLIVQHSPDRAFQKQVAAAMGALLPSGEISGPNYALLYDRTEMIEGRPQRYGSQGRCKDGVLVIHTLEDPARVDELRRSVGLTQSLEDYGKSLGVGRRC